MRDCHVWGMREACVEITVLSLCSLLIHVCVIDCVVEFEDCG